MKKNHHALGFQFVICILFSGIWNSSAAPIPIYSLPNTSSTSYSYETTQRQPASTTIFLPIVYRSDPFSDNTPIWSDTLVPTSAKVVLFRKEFHLDQGIREAKLALFADTRYSVWFDGVWLGRGPARFSQTLREYDLLSIGDLPAGEHLIAILVQWAPNVRRAESTRPHLMAHLEGMIDDTETIVLRSGVDWKTFTPNAWNDQASQVHAWNLIGPTELLDLRTLPKDWHQVSFDDQNWEHAQVVNLHLSSLVPFHISKLDDYPILSKEVSAKSSLFLTSFAPFSETITFQPRSLPLSIETSVPITLRDAGSISPGFMVGEITPPFDDPTTLSFYASQPHLIVVQVLSEGLPITQISLDGQELEWKQDASSHPDIYLAEKEIEVGFHILNISQIPASGLTFAVSSQENTFEAFPFGQGVHAGRRTLLANLVSEPTVVTSITQAEHSLDLEINSLPGYIVLELPRVIHGRLYATVSGAAGTILDIGWDERLTTKSTRPLPYPGSLHSQWNQVDSWILDNQPREITTIDARAGRYILICLWGSGSVHLSHLRVVEEKFPTELIGSFHSSDPLLDQIWQTGVETIIPNMTDAYTDTPWRERGQWWGDAYVEEKINQVSFGQTDLIRRGLLFMADAMKKDPSPLMAPSNYGGLFLDFTMLWVHNLWDYHNFVGDASFTKSLYPFVSDFMTYLERYQNTSSGLLETPRTPRLAYIDTLGWHSRYGQATALNALYAGTLHVASRLAQEVGDEFNATKWEAQAIFIADRINDHLYDANRHSYYATYYENGYIEPTVHAQAFALAYNIVPESEREAVAEVLLNLLSDGPETPPVGTYGMFWVLDALGKSGKLQEAFDVIKTYYGYMLSNGATTWWEHFTANQFWHQSLSHGWSGAPTWFLSTYALGFQRVSQDVWQIKPALQEFSHLQGEVPVGKDKVVIRWKWQNCSHITMHIDTPENTQGVFLLPNSFYPAGLFIDEVEVFPDSLRKGKPWFQDEDEFALSIPGGQHDIQMIVACSSLPN